MFASTANFGLTVLVILDNHLQKFFEMVPRPLLARGTFCGARPPNAWKDWKIGDHHQSSFPQCLRRTQTAPKGGGNDPGPGKKKKSSTADNGKKKLATVSNLEPQQAWSIPHGKRYLDFFAMGPAHKTG